MYKLGLDIGITSVGWAVLNTDINGEPNRIIDLGVRIFDAAENPKDGASLAAPRREARGARRRNRRRNHRKDRIKSLLQNSGIIDKKSLENLYHPENGIAALSDIYMVRYEALNRLLTNEELARLLLHFSQRRGFKSNRKSDDSGDNGLLLKATSENLKYIQEKGYQTVGEMLYKDEKYIDHKRNKGGTYENTFLRRQIEDEIKLIFASQKSFGNEYITDNFAQKYMDILFSQRDFSEGPGEGSPYGGNQIENMIGFCTFEPKEKRAAKATYTFELFNLWQKINAVKIVSYGEKRELTREEKLIIESLCHKSEAVDYKKIRKALNLSENEMFSALSYGDKDVADVEKAKFQYLPAYHTMRKAFDGLAKGYFDKNISVEKRDIIGTALTYYKSDDKIREYVTANTDADDKFSDEEMNVVINIKNFSKVGNLSLKAMKKITPFLMEGMTYDKAADSAGYNFRAENNGEKKKYLPKLPEDIYDITSPVVKRAINQTIKVVNAVVKEYGSPASINIELAREMHKNHKDRDKIKKDQKANEADNQRVYDLIKTTFKVLKPSGQDIIKYRLWEEQDGRCLYSGKPVEAEKLFQPGYCEVDHIIPYSISFDDTFGNKALVLTQENRNKGNRLPLQYITDKDSFRVRVNTTIRNKAKRDRLLKETIGEDADSMKQRNLTDTQFITTFIYNYIRNNLLFDETYQGKKKVTAVNGRVTSYMRKRWGIAKIRENGDLHHCIDAAVVACITDGMIRRVTNYAQWMENRFHNADTAYAKNKFPPPWDTFVTELDIRTSPYVKELLSEVNLPNYMDIDMDSIKPVFVSRMTKKKLTGAAHKATIRGYRQIDGEMKTVSKTPLKNLKLDKNNEIAGYYNKGSDILLYNLLRDKLVAAGGNGEKAFPEGFVYKPAPKGGTAPKVKAVKISDKASLVVPVNKDVPNSGVAGNGDMVRIDLYKVEGDGYYFVPVYVSDLVKDELPAKASVRAKPYEQWKEMAEENFLYSIYPNDLLKITHKKDMKFSLNQKDATGEKEILTKEIFAYYTNSDIATASIRIISHENKYSVRGLGIKTISSIEKYHVDVLGNIYKAPLEKRRK